MVTEDNAATQNTTEVTQEKSEDTQQTTQDAAAELEKQLKETQSQLAKAQEEIQIHRANQSKTSKQLRESQQWQAKVENLEKTAEVQTQMLADLIDRLGNQETEPPPRKRSEEYLSRLKKEPTPPKAPEEWEEANRIAREAGLDIMNSDELAKAYRYFTQNKLEEGLAEAKKVADSIRKTKEAEANKPKSKTVDELTEAEREEIARQVMEKKGLLTTDVGKAAGTGGMTKEKATALYASGDMSEEEARKHGVF